MLATDKRKRTSSTTVVHCRAFSRTPATIAIVVEKAAATARPKAYYPQTAMADLSRLVFGEAPGAVIFMYHFSRSMEITFRRKIIADPAGRGWKILVCKVCARDSSIVMVLAYSG
ncbi:hypothetical protein DL762_000133 [Monosporascus cannonballus]|uniref:Uncharacterized protein n=1 Tax=Monosporascus cannonballus TaxID=155416 RepID=A0ABY0HJX8_9PEZI|nr:hypothetical protein DL762_000133 [Monosporascus cannonballus]